MSGILDNKIAISRGDLFSENEYLRKEKHKNMEINALR